MTEIRKISANLMFYDHEYYQRKPEERHEWWKKRSGPRFRENLLGALIVSARPDGKFAIIDGAGRWYLMTRLRNQSDYVFTCLVHTGLSRKEEAELYRDLNDRVKINPNDRFKVELTLENEDAVAVAEILKKHNLTTTRNDLPSPNKFKAMWRGGVLDDTIRLIQVSGWNIGKHKSLASIWYEAIGSFIKIEPNFDESRLLQVMNENPPAVILRKMKEIGGQFHPNYKAVRAAQIIAELYNQRLRTRPRLDISNFQQGQDFYAVMGAPDWDNR